jgi:hypothetical protein
MNTLSVSINKDSKVECHGARNKMELDPNHLNKVSPRLHIVIDQIEMCVYIDSPKALADLKRKLAYAFKQAERGYDFENREIRLAALKKGF